MKAGFIGLGVLGKTMARHLIEQGVELVVWNRTAEKGADLGVSVAANPAEVMAQVPVVVLNLRDSGAVEAVLRGENGLLAGDCAGKIIIDTTTNHYEPVVRFEAWARERGATYLEAPVLGSVIPASKGALTVLVGGDQVAFETARPLLDQIGSTIFYMGPQMGQATKMKLVNNLVLGSFMAAIAEAVTFGEAAGLDKKQVLDILAAGAGNSGVLNAKRQKLLDQDFAPHFAVELIYKDLHYLQDLARNLERPLFTGSVVKEMFGLAMRDGLGQNDLSAIYSALKGKR